MNRFFVTIFMAALVLLFASGARAQSDGAIVVSADRVLHDRGMKLDSGWRYHAGDDPSWADPGFDDSSWRPVPQGSLRSLDTLGEWQGVSWFRLRLEVPPELRNRVLSIAISQIGATECYFDGHLVRVLGKVGPLETQSMAHLVADAPVLTPVAFDDRPQHVLAVRFAQQSEWAYKFENHPRHGSGGLEITLCTMDAGMTSKAEFLFEHTTHRTLSAATAMTIAILHLLLFVFYPRQIVHLYYAVFTMSAAVIAYVPLYFITTPDPADLAAWFRVWQIALIVVSVSGLRFLYAIFYDRLPRVFWLWLGGGALVAIVFWNGPLTRVFYFTLITFAEILRVLVIAVIKRKRFAWLIASGIAAFILASAFQILTALISPGRDTPDYYLYGLLVMLIIMSVGLALGFAQTNRHLARRLDEVKELSAERLEQERRAKEQEIERMRLEADNELKAKELDEARKRQKVLDELAVANQELRQTQAQLVQSEKMAALGSLVAGIAHEINTPVGAICSMHDTLTRAVGKLKKEIAPDDGGDSKLQATIKVIEDASEVIQSGSSRVTTIVRRLRSFARLDEAEMKRVDIHEGLEDTLILVHHELKYHVTVHRNYGDLPHVECYPARLNQVFLNLLVNARQAIEGDGDITITTSHRDDKVYIEIKDNGRGIPEEQVSKIFDPGFTTKGVGVGTGLGLSICYQIIQDHKGEIIVGSKVGEGTTFTIVLPVDLD